MAQTNKKLLTSKNNELNLNLEVKNEKLLFFEVDAHDEVVFGRDEVGVPQHRQLFQKFSQHFCDRFCGESFEGLVAML
jgi:hypothetical protein